MSEWFWLPKAWGVADGGAYAKLFQGKGYSWEILAREVTQNSWDAARRWQRELMEAGRIESASDVKFSLQFDFRDLVGRDKGNLVAGLRLHDLRSKLIEIGESSRDIDPDAVCLSALGDLEVPIRALYVHDYGATGLRGDPVGPGMEDSDFYRAFGQIGGNDRPDGGGAFGFGKSAFIKASRIRCVVAYSSFESSPGDSATRRLWGFVYWKGFGGMTGIGQLGALLQDHGPKSSPVIDAEADVLAKQLGFMQRSANSPEDCGTSLLIVDHAVEPEDLQKALEIYWWPALETFRDRFSVRVKTETGFLDLQPKSRKYLLPFVRAFEIARDSTAQVKEEGERRREFQAITEAGGIKPGVIAMVRVDDASDSEVLADGMQQSLIALIREPRMVVQYQAHGTANPIVQGVFVADPEADPALRSSEPGAHDVWQTHISEDHGKDWKIVKEVALAVHKRVRNAVLEFQRSLRPKPEPQNDRLRFADELLAKLFKPPKQPGDTDTERGRRRSQIVNTQRLSRNIVRRADGSISCSETWKLDVASSPKGKRYAVVVRPRAIVLTDGDAGGAAKDDHLGMSVTASPGWSVVAGDTRVEAQARPGDSVEVTIETDPYNELWSIKTELQVDWRVL